MLLNVLAVSVLCWFAWRGARRGGLASGLGLATLAVSYGVAVLAASTIGPWMTGQFDLSGLLVIPFVGTLGFGAGVGLMALVSRSAKRKFPSADKDGHSARDRFLGCAFGAARGAMVVLLLSYLALWIDALRVTGAAEGMPVLADSVTAKITEEVLESVLETAMGDSGPMGRVVARLASHPGAVLVDLQAVLENRHIAAVQGDRLFWANMEAGAVGSALNTRSLVDLIYDEELRYQLAAIGLVEPEAAADPGLFRAALDEVFREVAPRIRNLRNDPALQGLLGDPELIAMLQTGDTLGLIRHPGVRELASRVSSGAAFD